MSVVTIRGQLGSGAPEIGKKVAESIQAEYVDRQIIYQVAERLRWPPGGIEEKEMPPGTLMGRIEGALKNPYVYMLGSNNPAYPPYAPVSLPLNVIPLDDPSYLAGLESIIKELAKSPSIVICGRGSHFILKDTPGTFHVLVVAPLGLRVQRIMESMNLNETEAKKEITSYDNSRREFIKKYFKAEIEAPVHYDLVVNTAHLSFDNAAAIVVAAIPLRDK